MRKSQDPAPHYPAPHYHTTKALVADEDVKSILFCPGFTNKDVAGIQDAVGDGVGVCVARGDTPSNRIAGKKRVRSFIFYYCGLSR